MLKKSIVCMFSVLVMFFVSGCGGGSGGSSTTTMPPVVTDPDPDTEPPVVDPDPGTPDPVPVMDLADFMERHSAFVMLRMPDAANHQESATAPVRFARNADDSFTIKIGERLESRGDEYSIGTLTDAGKNIDGVPGYRGRVISGSLVQGGTDTPWQAAAEVYHDDHVSFGMWMAANGEPAEKNQIHLGAFGSRAAGRTNHATLDALKGSGSYSGTTVGYHTNGDSIQRFEGSVMLNVDFTQMTASGQTSHLIADDGSVVSKGVMLGLADIEPVVTGMAHEGNREGTWKGAFAGNEAMHMSGSYGIRNEQESLLGAFGAGVPPRVLR